LDDARCTAARRGGLTELASLATRGKPTGNGLDAAGGGPSAGLLVASLLVLMKENKEVGKLRGTIGLGPPFCNSPAEGVGAAVAAGGDGGGRADNVRPTGGSGGSAFGTGGSTGGGGSGTGGGALVTSGGTLGGYHEIGGGGGTGLAAGRAGIAAGGSGLPAGAGAGGEAVKAGEVVHGERGRARRWLYT
jgi:hypothetical protein